MASVMALATDVERRLTNPKMKNVSILSAVDVAA